MTLPQIIALVKAAPLSKTQPAWTTCEEITGKWFDDEDNEMIYATDIGLMFRKVQSGAGGVCKEYGLLPDLKLAQTAKILAKPMGQRVVKVKSL